MGTTCSFKAKLSAQLLRTLNECGFTRGEVEAALAEVDAAGDAGAAPAA
jgi:hypothetical protein